MYNRESVSNNVGEFRSQTCSIVFPTSMLSLSEEPVAIAHWRSQIEAYDEEMERWGNAFRRRRDRSQSHPIHDFLFVYYRFPSAKLSQWHPGINVPLEMDSTPLPSWFAPKFYSQGSCRGVPVVVCDSAKVDSKQRHRLRFTVDLLRQTSARRPHFGCYGMHEWAMVYRGAEVRHERTTPLRLPQDEIDQFVESRPIACTHFDAFRFFAIEAKPLNRIQPSLELREELEQPGCIHANMDLYKWAFKSMPWIGSDLLKDCFYLAMEAREVDMRASPYDLSSYGDYQPILVETKEGRAEYEDAQKQIYQKGQSVREKLINQLKQVLVSVENH